MISAHILFNYYIITENFINFYCMSEKNLLFFFYKTNIYELSEKGEHNIMAKIDHAAIRTKSYEDAQKFYEAVGFQTYRSHLELPLHRPEGSQKTD